MEEQTERLGNVKIRMPMTPNESMFNCIGYEVRVYNSGVPPVDFFVRPKKDDESENDEPPRYVVKRKDEDPLTVRTISDEFIRESGASRMAYREAKKLASQYSVELGVPIEDLGDRDALDLFENLEEGYRSGDNPDLDRGREADDTHGNSLRTRWGLEHLR